MFDPDLIVSCWFVAGPAQMPLSSILNLPQPPFQAASLWMIQILILIVLLCEIIPVGLTFCY